MVTYLKNRNLEAFVSIPDRVLGIFRLGNTNSATISQLVSIPDRVLGIFRLFTQLAGQFDIPFQSLIGF